MSLYLDELGRGGSLARRVQERVLDSRGPLFNDPREVLEDELREPGVYFSILERTTEEIDVVGHGRGRVTLVGECKWTRRKLDARVLDDLERHKLPALARAG